MGKIDKKKLGNLPNHEDSISDINKELKDIINENNSLKKGLSKIFKEIKKNNKTNN